MNLLVRVPGPVVLCLVIGSACASAPPRTSPAPLHAPSDANTTTHSTSLTDSPGIRPWTAQCGERDATEVLHHDIDLTVQLDPTPSLSGRGELRVRALRATSVVVLDARKLQITSISVGTESLHFQQVDDSLCIELPDTLGAGDTRSLQLAWEGSTRGKMPKFFPGQVWAGYRASAWMPTKQDPSQRATLALRIKAPAILKAVASGRLVGRTQPADGWSVSSFVLERPSPPFLYAFAVGDFAEAERDVDGVKLRALGPKGADLESALEVTEPMLRLLAKRTGMPFPASAYTQVFVHGDAAQEAAGMSLLSESALSDLKEKPTEDWIFSHELAHQWFAWLVPCADFADFWLNEGFATFFVAVVKEQRWGRAAYERELTLWRERSAKVHAEGRDAPISLSSPHTPHTAPSESDLPPMGVTYSRGALVLHKLRQELGEEFFWAGMRRYVRDRSEKGARTEHLREALEAVSGRDLRAFFAAFIYTAASNL